MKLALLTTYVIAVVVFGYSSAKTLISTVRRLRRKERDRGPEDTDESV